MPRALIQLWQSKRSCAHRGASRLPVKSLSSYDLDAHAIRAVTRGGGRPGQLLWLRTCPALREDWIDSRSRTFVLQPIDGPSYLNGLSAPAPTTAQSIVVRRRILEIYWFMERRLVPGLETSQRGYERALDALVPQGVDWLDLGCGRGLLPSWRQEAEARLAARANLLVGIDLDHASLRENTVVTARCCGGVPDLPFKDESFDVVTGNMVVEHIDDPAHAFAEVRRVLRPGGLFVFHTPNSAAFPTSLARRIPEFAKATLARVLDGRKRKDVFPTYYRANTISQIQELARSAGLVSENIDLVSTTALFAVVPPLALLELLWLRSLRHTKRRHLRSNFVVALRKPASDTRNAEGFSLPVGEA